MRLSHEQMYQRMLASDPAFNGRFFTGVLTTGIYCLPTCKARKPRRENVRFFPSCEAARAAGLRACKKCHPDDFARGADPVLDDIETVVAEIRRAPAAFGDVRDVVRRSGFGATRLFELFRQHFHASPADILLRARVAWTKERLLATDEGLLAIAEGAGFESASVFHEHFRRLNGLTPAAYRDLRRSRSFTLALPPDYPVPYLRRALGRDPGSVNERLAGDRYVAAVRTADAAARFEMDLAADAVHVRGDENLGGPDAHAIAIGLLGLDQDAAAFARLAQKLGLARLVAGRQGLRIAQTASVFDGLLWSIIGQQITFGFACTLKRRLTERFGQPIGDGLVAPPIAAAIAETTPAALTALQFSQRKAEYLIDAARAVVSGELDLAAMRTMSATRAERLLLSRRGLGPWSVNYLMMRALGFADCVPLGDTGVTSGLQALFRLEQRPDVDATRRLMAPFAPYRSLATAHLWQFDRPAP